MDHPRPFRREDFEIAIICALPLEYDAVTYVFEDFFDEGGDPYGKAEGDPNIYATGRSNQSDTLLPTRGKVPPFSVPSWQSGGLEHEILRRLSKSPASSSLQRLPFSSAFQSPAPPILQPLPVSSASQSLAPPSLQRLPFSSAFQSPAPPSLQRLPVSSACHSPAPAIL